MANLSLSLNDKFLLTMLTLCGLLITYIAVEIKKKGRKKSKQKRSVSPLLVTILPTLIGFLLYFFIIFILVYTFSLIEKLIYFYPNILAFAFYSIIFSLIIISTTVIASEKTNLKFWTKKAYLKNLGVVTIVILIILPVLFVDYLIGSIFTSVFAVWFNWEFISELILLSSGSLFAAYLIIVSLKNININLEDNIPKLRSRGLFVLIMLLFLIMPMVIHFVIMPDIKFVSATNVSYRVVDLTSYETGFPSNRMINAEITKEVIFNITRPGMIGWVPVKYDSFMYKQDISLIGFKEIRNSSICFTQDYPPADCTQASDINQYIAPNSGYIIFPLRRVNLSPKNSNKILLVGIRKTYLTPDEVAIYLSRVEKIGTNRTLNITIENNLNREVTFMKGSSLTMLSALSRDLDNCNVTQFRITERYKNKIHNTTAPCNSEGFCEMSGLDNFQGRLTNHKASGNNYVGYEHMYMKEKTNVTLQLMITC